MKTTTLLLATVLFLTVLTCLVIGSVTYQSAGSPNWQLVQIVSAIGLGLPIFAWLWVRMFNVFFPLLLWVSWKYFCLIEWAFGIRIGAWFGKQLIGDPMIHGNERGFWPFLHREVAGPFEPKESHD